MLVGAYLIVSIICGFITKSMNENKGYDGGFLWGFLLSVIGIIVVAVKPFNQVKQVERPTEILSAPPVSTSSKVNVSSNTETIGEQPIQKDLWISKRIKGLLATGLSPSDSKIKAEMEYSLVLEDPEELKTYNKEDILAIASLFFSMKSWSMAKLCYKAALSIDDSNESALVGAMLSDLHRNSLEECRKCSVPLQNNEFYGAILDKCSSESSSKVKEINDSIVQRNEETKQRNVEAKARAVSQYGIPKEEVGSDDCAPRKKSKSWIIIFVIVLIAALCGGIYYYINVYMPKKTYRNAESLIAEKRYIEAYSILSNLSYQDSAERARAIFPDVQEEYYNKALSKIESGQLREGYDILCSIGSYKDCLERIYDLRPTIQKMSFDNPEVGKTVLFGEYGGYYPKRDIEWIIVEATSEQLVLLSKKILEVKEFNSTGHDLGVGSASELQKWLTDGFVTTAFSAEQRQCMRVLRNFRESFRTKMMSKDSKKTELIFQPPVPIICLLRTRQAAGG